MWWKKRKIEKPIKIQNLFWDFTDTLFKLRTDFPTKDITVELYPTQLQNIIGYIEISSISSFSALLSRGISYFYYRGIKIRLRQDMESITIHYKEGE